MKPLLLGICIGALTVRLLARRESRVLGDGVRLWWEEALLR